MKNRLVKTQFIALLFLLIGNAAIAQWSKVITIDTFKRDREVTFVIGDTAYVGTGDSGNFQYLGDFRAYTQKGNTWVKARPFPIVGGDDGFFFVINDTAYVGGGANPSYLNEFYAYTPSAGWINKGSAPGGIARVTGIGFSIGETGYAGTGTSYGTQLDDFWKYDPATNMWDTIPHYPHPAGGCVAFAVNGKGYVGLGQQNNILYNDMYQYDPATNKWDTMASVPTPWGWSTASHFVICGKLIIALGDTAAPGGSFTTKQTWMFDPSNGPKGKWTRLQDFPGPLPDYAASGFTMGDTGFVYGGCIYTNNFYRAALYRYVSAFSTATITPADTTVCPGSQVKLSASGGTSYIWSTGDTTSSITINPVTSQTYYVTVSSGACSGNDSTELNVNMVPPLVINPPSPAIECNGQGIVLSVPASGSDYIWSPATGLSATTGSSVTANPTADITYTVTGLDSLGCAVRDSEVISIKFGPNKPIITLSANGDTLISSATNGNQWYVNGTAVSGAIDSTFVIKGLPNNDTITVSVTDVANGCSTSSADFITGINQLTVSSGQLIVYPNPTNGMLYVNISSSVSEIKDWNLQLINVLGQTLYARSSLNYKNEIDLTGLPGGVYFITIITNTGKAVVTVVKQ